MKLANLQFKQAEDGAYTFNTGVLEGVLRQEGKSIGLFPVIHKQSAKEISTGTGLLNHYRVFTKGKRYGYGARRWPSTAKLLDNGSVEVSWPATLERPFEIQASYTWTAANSIDLITKVQAKEQLESFEIFLASYFQPSFTDSRVFASRDPRGGNEAGFISADKELGEWLAFPRDELATVVIKDGRWELEPHPLTWTMMPTFEQAIAIRRDSQSGLTTVSLTWRDECFGVFTPYGEEKHISNYMSIFGRDFASGEIAQSHSRLVVLPTFNAKEVLEVAEGFLQASNN